MAANRPVGVQGGRGANSLKRDAGIATAERVYSVDRGDFKVFRDGAGEKLGKKPKCKP